MKYYVQTVSRPYATGVPEEDWQTRMVTSSARAAYIRYCHYARLYNLGSQSWSGHVRIVGSDGLLYEPYEARGPGEEILAAVPYSQYDADARREALKA